MNWDALDERYAEVLAEIERRAQLTERFLDTDAYRILLATVWASAVLEPRRAGLEEGDLETLFAYLNARTQQILGGDAPLFESCRYLLSRDGQQAMERLHVPAGHREQLLRIAELMVDPEGLRRALQSHWD